MGPNGIGISKDYFFDPRESTAKGIEMPVGSRTTRQMIDRKEIRKALDTFSGKCKNGYFYEGCSIDEISTVLYE